jgi:hypothetical protein
LAEELTELMDELEHYVPGDATITRSCYDEEVSRILPEAPPGSPQLFLLENTLLWRDDRLQEVIARREQGTVAGNPRVDENGLIERMGDVRNCQRLGSAWYTICVLLAMLMSKMHYLTITRNVRRATHGPTRRSRMARSVYPQFKGLSV